TATPDTIRHFTNGYGDDNPLYCDPSYAAKTRWGSVIGPPMYEVTMGFPEVTEVDEATRALLKGDPLVGVGQYLSGEDWEFWQPVYPGDVLYQRTCLVSVEVKESAFSGGKSALLRHRTLYRNQRGEPVSAQYKLFIHAEREASAKAGKYMNIQRPQYTPEMLAEIDRAYAEERVRGAEQRYWEDVAAGEELPQIVKGPLLVTDIISSHIGR